MSRRGSAKRSASGVGSAGPSDKRKRTVVESLALLQSFPSFGVNEGNLPSGNSHKNIEENCYDLHLARWAATKAANPDLESAQQGAHQLQQDHDLSTDDCHLAICSVTEAMTDENGRRPFGLVTAMALAAWRDPDMLGQQRVVRPKRPLIIPWTLSPLSQGYDPGTDDRRFGAEENQQRRAAAATALASANANGHQFLAIFEPQGGDIGNILDLPSIRVMDSFPYTADQSIDLESQNMMTFAENVKWYHARGVDARIQFQSHNKAPWIRHSVAPQNSQWRGPCGIHTILNGWAYAMNVHKRLNTRWAPTAADYQTALELITSALQGFCDFWLIYWWMRSSKFLNPFPSNQNGRISRSKVTLYLNSELREELLLVEEGARFFNQTLRMEGVVQRVGNQRFWRGDDHLEQQVWEPERDQEDAQWAMVQAARFHAHAHPSNEQRSHLIKTIKEEIRREVLQVPDDDLLSGRLELVFDSVQTMADTLIQIAPGAGDDGIDVLQALGRAVGGTENIVAVAAASSIISAAVTATLSQNESTEEGLHAPDGHSQKLKSHGTVVDELMAVLGTGVQESSTRRVRSGQPAIEERSDHFAAKDTHLPGAWAFDNDRSEEDFSNTHPAVLNTNLFRNTGFDVQAQSVSPHQHPFFPRDQSFPRNQMAYDSDDDSSNDEFFDWNMTDRPDENAGGIDQDQLGIFSQTNDLDALMTSDEDSEGL